MAMPPVSPELLPVRASRPPLPPPEAERSPWALIVSPALPVKLLPIVMTLPLLVPTAEELITTRSMPKASVPPVMVTEFDQVGPKVSDVGARVPETVMRLSEVSSK